jgi:copper resistance protein C
VEAPAADPDVDSRAGDPKGLQTGHRDRHARSNTGSASRLWPAARRGRKDHAVPLRSTLRLVVTLALLFPALAQAHAILEDSTPPIGGSVPPGALDLRLRYNSRIDHARSRLTLTHPDKSHDVVPIIPDSPPDIIAAHFDVTPGDYVLRWQVLAVDGHITRGDIPFTVTAP